MPRPQALGRPGTPVIPKNWSQAPRAIVAKTLTVGAVLRHPGGVKEDFDPETGTWPTTPRDAYWSGKARVQVTPIFGGGEEDAATEPVTEVSYLIVVPLEAVDPVDGNRVGDLLDLGVVDCNGDTSLTGRTLTVKSIARGSLAWERDLVCVDYLTPAPPAT